MKREPKNSLGVWRVSQFTLSFPVSSFTLSCSFLYFFLLIISPRSFSFSDDDDDDDDGVNNYDADDGDDDVDDDDDDDDVDDDDDDDGSWQPPPSHPLILLQPSLSRPQITSQVNKPLICLLILHGA